MKKDKVKSVKRKIRDDIKLSLVTELKALTGKFGDASTKLDKEINRSAKKLAKEISKEIRIEEPVVAVPAQEVEGVIKAVKTSDKKVKVKSE
jgi:hypothetical protein